MISKQEVSGGNRRTGVVFSKQEPRIQNGNVGTYVLNAEVLLAAMLEIQVRFLFFSLYLIKMSKQHRFIL